MAPRFPSRTLALTTAAILSMALIAGCGSDDESSNGSASSESTSTEGAPANTPGLEELYEGSYEEPPTEAPPAAKGKSVWWISCSQAVPSCVQPAEAAAEAAEMLGIEFNVADGKFNAGGAFSSAIRTALAAKPDAILLFGVACELTRGALADAKAQDVIVMGAGGTPDCADSGGPQLFSAKEVMSEKYPTVPEFWAGYAAFAADYIIAKSGGKAKVINNAGSEPLQKMVNDGFVKELEKCSGCEIVETVPYSSPDLVPNGPWIQAFRSALVRHPDATAVYLPWEVMWSIGGAQALKESGRELISTGGQGAPDGFPFIRQGEISAISSAQSTGWNGYAAIDTINRVMQGEDPVPQGLGFQTVDNENNLPADDQYVPPVDYEAAYKKAWGVE